MAFAAFRLTVTDENGVIQPNAVVSVALEVPGSPLAYLYSDREGFNGLTNPTFADAQGFVQFFTDGGAYQITATNTLGTFSRTWRYVGIGTMQEYDYGTVLLPQGGWNAATIYTIGDLVSHNYPGGGPYAFLSSINNNEGNEPQFTDATTPVSDTYWTVMGMFEGVGAPGAPGIPGPPGPNLGIDYNFVEGPTVASGEMAIDSPDDPTAVTLIAFHSFDANLTDNSAFLAAQGQSTSTPKGSLMIVSLSDRANWLALDLLTPFTAGTASVAYVDHAGDLRGIRVGVLFTDKGDAGTDGVDGIDGAPGSPGADASGDVVGPTSAGTDAIALFSDGTGKRIGQSIGSTALNLGAIWARFNTPPATGGGAGGECVIIGNAAQGVFVGTGNPTMGGAGFGSLYLDATVPNNPWVSLAGVWTRLLTAGITEAQIFTAPPGALLLKEILERRGAQPKDGEVLPFGFTPFASLSGNITIGAKTRRALFIGQAAGGGGGGVSTTSGPGAAGAGGPGETRLNIVDVTPGQVIPYLITSEGGPGGTTTPGNTAGDLTIGTAAVYMLCKGGTGGVNNSGGGLGANGTTPAGGSGGIRIPPTSDAWNHNGSGVVYSVGGSTIFGKSRERGVALGAQPGDDGQPGGCGGGGAKHYNTTSAMGGWGGPGLILMIGFGG